jgi:hypothetical protein
MSVTARAVVVAGIVAFSGCLYWFVIRPWRRDHRLTPDGLLLFGFLALIWQDPIINYTQTWLSYSSVLPNHGSWGPHIPGWLSPEANLMPEPLVFLFPAYGYSILGIAVVGSGVMRRAKAKYPQLGILGLVAICYGFIVVAFAILEIFWMRLGIYSYPGAIKRLTLFHGHYYQFPIYEAFGAALVFTVFSCVRYFRNDQGHTWAERGIERVRATSRQKTVLRFLALTGMLNVLFLVSYFVPMQFFALHADRFPKDILNRSYLTNGMCGPGTSYACAGPGIPIPRVNSAHVGPDGRLVAPPERQLP